MRIDPTVVTSTGSAGPAAPVAATDAVQGPKVDPSTAGTGGQTPLSPATKGAMGARASSEVALRQPESSVAKGIIDELEAMVSAPRRRGGDLEQRLGMAIWDARQAAKALSPADQGAIEAKIGEAIVRFGAAEVAQERALWTENQGRLEIFYPYSMTDFADSEWAWVHGGGKASVEPLSDEWMDLAKSDAEQAPEARRLLGEMARLAAEQTETGWQLGGQVHTRFSYEERVDLLCFDRFQLTRAGAAELLAAAEQALAEGDGAFATRLAGEVGHVIPDAYDLRRAAKADSPARRELEAAWGPRGYDFESATALRQVLDGVLTKAAPKKLEQKARLLTVGIEGQGRAQFAGEQLERMKAEIERAPARLGAALPGVLEVEAEVRVARLAQNLALVESVVAAAAATSWLDVEGSKIGAAKTAAERLEQLAPGDARAASAIAALTGSLQASAPKLVGELEDRIAALRSEAPSLELLQRADANLWSSIDSGERVMRVLKQDPEAVRALFIDHGQLVVDLAGELLASGAVAWGHPALAGLESSSRPYGAQRLDPERAQALAAAYEALVAKYGG